MHNIKIYDKYNIDSLLKEEVLISQDWLRYLMALMKAESPEFIKNFNCEYLIVQIGKKIIPIVKNDNKKNNSHLTSISIYYTLFALESLKHKVMSRLIFFLLKSIVFIFSKLINISKLDKAILVNCWCIPTGPTTVLTDDEYFKILFFLKEKYPGHAIIFRGYNNNLLIDQKKEKLDNLLLSKISYVIEDVQSILKKGHVKQSLKLSAESLYSEYDKEIITDSNWKEILNLYNDLYIKKYSQYSLQLTEKWFKLISQNKEVFLKFRKKDNKIVSFVIFFIDGDYTSSSIASVEKSSSDFLHLYSLNFISQLQASRILNKKMNLSSGGDSFKKKRGGEPRYEYDIIHYSHLKGGEKLRWKIFYSIYQSLSNKVYNRIMMKK